MKFAISFLLLLSSASGRVFEASGDVPLDSPLGQRLLAKATVVEASRHLNNNNNENSFLSSYAIKYLGCAGLVQVNAEGQGNNNNGQNNILSMNNLVRFALCPADSCSSCSGGGEYVVNMNDFVDAYTEYKLTEQEQTCEDLREASGCDGNDDEEGCESTYYTNQGQEECIQYEGQADFEIQRYLECGEFKANNNNGNNGDGSAYYIGAYCSPKDGKSIYMGIFTDQGCLTKGDSAVFSASYGTDLPYASSSMVASDCIACSTVEENDNGEQNYQLEELCQKTYENAAKCETNMDSYYKDTSACDYIQNILPRLEAASRSVSGGGSTKASTGSSKAATAFAWIFAATTVMFGAYAYFLYRKIKRGTVNLSAQDGAIA